MNTQIMYQARHIQIIKNKQGICQKRKNDLTQEKLLMLSYSINRFKAGEYWGLA